MKTFFTITFSLVYINLLFAQKLVKKDTAVTPPPTICIFDLAEIVVTDYVVPYIDHHGGIPQHFGFVTPYMMKFEKYRRIYSSSLFGHPTLRAQVQENNDQFLQIYNNEKNPLTMLSRFRTGGGIIDDVWMSASQIQEANVEQFRKLYGGTSASCGGKGRPFTLLPE